MPLLYESYKFVLGQGMVSPSQKNIKTTNWYKSEIRHMESQRALNDVKKSYFMVVIGLSLYLKYEKITKFHFSIYGSGILNRKIKYRVAIKTLYWGKIGQKNRKSYR